jgi:two-component system sensor histidine kinase TctE
MTDTGKGVPEGQLAAVRKRFSRGESDKPGAGLGLPIVEEIATLFGGTVAATSSPGNGFKLEIRFPPVG